ncbi:2,4-dienoyl-CoA reductase-like NADH-dependent reductase (Old Yellow Enzyme family) [Roseovarius sp. MBR-154]|jgi:2,4-dienoyl-CoA reductase-like NADH-dependent reductase (Old Yellow Enzyme family)
MSRDPLLQPYTLRHLTLKNRIMTTAHEPAYPEDGLPTDRYRAYHVERAKGGVALTMTAGSAVVSRDSPPGSVPTVGVRGRARSPRRSAARGRW